MPVVRKLIDLYIFWQPCFLDLPKTTRFTLGHKIDLLFLECIEQLNVAGCVEKHHKRSHVVVALQKIDTLKLFIQLLWEMKQLKHRRTGHLATQLVEIGKMTGGWLKHLESK